MEKQLSFLNKLSNKFLGVSLYKEVMKNRIQVFKCIFCTILGISFVVFEIHTAFFNTTTSHQKKLQLICQIFGAVTVPIIFISYWRNAEQFQLIIKWIQERYLTRDCKFIDDIATIEYANVPTSLLKIMKIFAVMYMSSDVIFQLLPYFVDSMEYPSPLIIPGINSSKPAEYKINYAYQSVHATIIMLFLFIYAVIFIFISTHILTEIKVVQQVVKSVGDLEEATYLRQLKMELQAQSKPRRKNLVKETKTAKNQRELDLELLNEIYDELTNEPPTTLFSSNLVPVPGTSSSSQPKIPTDDLEGDLNKHFDAIHEILFDKPKSTDINKISSAEILKNVVVMHNDILSIANTTIKIYSVSTLLYEVLMVMSHAYTFAFFFIDRVAMLTIVPVMVAITVQYFCFSFISANIEEALADIGTAIYDSNWYWMSVSDQKTMLQILHVTTKSKSLSIGSFTDSNLERFTSVIHFSYDICLLLKFFMKKF